jgi:hypothetical protein
LADRVKRTPNQEGNNASRASGNFWGAFECPMRLNPHRPAMTVRWDDHSVRNPRCDQAELLPSEKISELAVGRSKR